jgi:amidase
MQIERREATWGAQERDPSRRDFLRTAGAAAAAMAASAPSAASAADDPFACLDGIGSAELIRSGQASAADVVEAAIGRIERLNPRLAAVCAPCFDRARERVRPGRPEGPFGGVPYLLKDLLEYPGVRYAAGSRMLASNVSNWRSPYLDATEAAGLVVLGKTATPEFGLTATTEPLLGEPTRNPWNPRFSPGGSSGGSAAAVAARLVPFAHGNDGGGSIRIPASMCGLFGLKPSRGRQPASQRTALPADILVDHCVSRSVRDSALLLALTERRDPGARVPPVGHVKQTDRRRLRIGVTTLNPYGRDAEAEVREAVLDVTSLCEALGHQVVEADWPLSGEEFAEHFMAVWTASAAGVAGLCRTRTGRDPDASVLEPWTLGLAAEFAHKPAAALPDALAYFKRLAADYARAFHGYDVFLSPVVRWARVLLGELAPTRDYEALRADLLDFASYTAAANAAGVPAMTVPLGWTPDGLPVGSQFTAALGGEATLLALALELERARPWAGRRPPVSA